MRYYELPICESKRKAGTSLNLSPRQEEKVGAGAVRKHNNEAHAMSRTLMELAEM